jgi:hypothetical protein
MLNLTAPYVCMWQLTGQPAPPYLNQSYDVGIPPFVSLIYTLPPSPPPPPTSLQLSPLPPPHSRLLFAYYILQGILHNTYIGIYMRILYYIILYVHGWYIKQPMYLLFIWAFYLVVLRGDFFGPKWHSRAQKSLDF